MRDRTLVTGFGAFGSVLDNPSAKLARESGRPFKVLEVAYEAADEFISSLDNTAFDRLLLMGVANSRDKFSVELFARNWRGKSADVRGVRAEGRIDEDAPLLLESELWNPENTSKIVVSDSHIRISMDAGDYLCNYVYYRAMQKIPINKVGFLHVPPESKMPLETQMESLQGILAELEES
jgi:pyroglutamyl-peptidase